MATYIIPIFCFGLVITGIVFLGVQQAADMAKQLAAQSNETAPGANNPPASSGRGSGPARPLASVIQP
jgi:hypothetical protein